MKFLPSILIAQLGVAWALPSPPQTDGLIYVPCSNIDIFNSAYCCVRGLLGDVSQCTLREGVLRIICLLNTGH
ncbi:hypothetical protein F5Y12DRAFT_575159 [Xylaria sp. FL1777]|nr:hypothetical protein F5Y12DRAFT_575159 [Xylaria sp. FL1777]